MGKKVKAWIMGAVHKEFNHATGYYRLKMVDQDSSFKYSHIVEINGVVKKSNTVTVYPNPFQKIVHLNFNECWYCKYLHL